MAAVVGVGRANHFRLVKLLWKYIKKHDLQNPANKNEIVCDDALKAVFKKDKVTSFGMSKLLSAHYFKDDAPAPKKRKSARDDGDDGAGDGGAAAPAPKKPKKKPAAASSAEYKGSREMADFCGVRAPRVRAPPRETPDRRFSQVETNNRFTITKIVWAHIKEHGLQKEGDKRTIICDETLKGLFQVDEFNQFQMAKLIGTHFS